MTTFQNVQMKLAGSRFGRITLHLICLCQDGKLPWHARGIIRELQRTELRARYSRLLHLTHPAFDASVMAKSVTDLHDTVFRNKPMKLVA